MSKVKNPLPLGIVDMKSLIDYNDKPCEDILHGLRLSLYGGCNDSSTFLTKLFYRKCLNA